MRDFLRCRSSALIEHPPPLILPNPVAEKFLDAILSTVATAR
jgi:hypothetical protein